MTMSPLGATLWTAFAEERGCILYVPRKTDAAQWIYEGGGLFVAQRGGARMESPQSGCCPCG